MATARGVREKSDLFRPAAEQYSGFSRFAHRRRNPTAPNTNANTPTKLGDADAGSYNPATGVVTITLATNKAEGIQPGQPLNGLNVRTFFNQPDAGQKGQRAASDITADGSYLLNGNGRCH